MIHIWSIYDPYIKCFQHSQLKSTESGDTICYAIVITVITVIVPASAFQYQVLPTVDVDLQHIQRLTSISTARCMEKNLLA